MSRPNASWLLFPLLWLDSSHALSTTRDVNPPQTVDAVHIAAGVSRQGTYKESPQGAALLRQVMTERGVPTTLDEPPPRRRPLR